MNQELVDQISKIARDSITNGVHTSLPCEVVKYDAKTGLVDLQPIGSYYNNGVEMEYPVIPSVPLVTGSVPAAGISICRPIKRGDKVLYTCTEQSISKFLTGTDVDQADEKFELQNGFAQLGAQQKPDENQEEANADDALIFQNGKVRMKMTEGKVELGTESCLITIDTETGEASIKGTKIVIDQDLEVKGKLKVTGKAVFDDDISGSGKLDISGDGSIGGDMSVSGTVHPGGCDLV